MTIVTCPHGCGGTINTATQLGCPNCRRGLNETEVVLSEYAIKIEGVWGWEYPDASPVQRKLSWCWEWWGPSHHRMRCRLPKNHDGKHWHHEERHECKIVSIGGEWVKI
jgi:hypothetical protein